MVSKKQYRIIYAQQVKSHIREIDKKHHSLIRKTIEDQLQYLPDQITRNKKPLRQPVGLSTDWEIRFGPDNRFRVFYNVDNDNFTVSILAVGIKRGNRLFIGKEEIIL